MHKAALLALLLVSSASAQVDEARLMSTLTSLPSPRSGLGPDANRANLAATEDLLRTALKESGYEVKEEAFDWPVRPRFWRPKPKPAPDAEQPADAPAHAEEPEERFPVITVRNLIVEIRGTTLPDEVLIVGAHFDAFEEAGGADDNGTGSAALLELARSLKGFQPDRTIRLAFFTLEENGLLGSRHHVKEWQRDDKAKETSGAPRERVIGMMSLEMLGYYSDEPDSQKSPIPAIKDVFEPPTVGNFIAITGIKKHQTFSAKLGALMAEGEPSLPVMRADVFPIAPPDLLRSDHAPFLLAGMPAVMITDTANFRNANYHKATDTVETIDAVRFARVVRALDHAIRGLSRKE